ncbi:S8 family peptidase [Pseudohoeflea coraliihabitans]|uniref:S8 family serine peptidase n=1 Tax=Pseudohoeflea coraliihabitans TaxID=2860393 RepID=A0ABS6WTG9_9HYPH|nr:S8 family serine peptidase [Pseudohoeflea sp. DP4N28-3]MBW3098355.1 S8 family serine peptidase [Pseudohoeflea sp. DP4N28-3]
MPETGTPAPQVASTGEYTANWGLAAIGADKALARGYTGAGVRIGVVDSSIQLSHPEFLGRADSFQFDDIDDGNHGTHVGGIIGANADGVGMQGVAPGALLSSIRIFESSGPFISSMQVADGYDAALADGIRLFNNSWGIRLDVTSVDAATAESYVSTTILDASRRAVAADAIIVRTTGNGAFDNAELFGGLPYHFPELQSNWIAVANVTPTLELRASSSACGVAAAWCLAAPGTDIYSTITASSYGNMTGTSMAAPHVTGALAIAREMFPDAAGSELAQLVFQTATDLGAPGLDPVFGWGLLNLGNIAETRDAQTASVFASAAWSRFAALRHVAAAIPNAGLGPPPLPGTGGLSTAYWPLARSDNPLLAGPAQPGPQRGLWASAAYGRANLSAESDQPGADADTGAALLGIDLVASDRERLGIAAGYSHTRLTSDPRGDSAGADGYHVLVYGEWQRQGWFASALGQLAYFDQTIERTNISGAGGTSAWPVGTSNPAGWAGELAGRFGHTIHSSGYEIAPYLAAAVRWQETGDFSESGAGIFALDLAQQSIQQFEIGPGIRLQTPTTIIGDHLARATLDVGYAWLTGDRDHPVAAGLLGSEFEGRTAELGEHMLRIGTDLEIAGSDTATTAVLSYDGLLQENASSHTISLGFRRTF